MAYLNLKAEMARNNIKINDLMEATGKSRSGISKNINGEGRFSIDESLAIRDKLFPDYSVDFLFKNSETKTETV